MDCDARIIDFLHKRIVHKKFQLKIPTLSENDCSATWKPNTYQKYDTCGKVRNVQRYQKYVVLLRSFIFIVSDIFKPTVCSLNTFGGTIENIKIHIFQFLHFCKKLSNSLNKIQKIKKQYIRFLTISSILLELQRCTISHFKA